MGIFGALTTAVTGMRAQSFALENISGNIANSQTTAFKRLDTSFEDLIPDQIPSKQLSGSVSASSRATNTVQGDLQGASNGTFMAINGQGFFVVEKPSSTTDNRPVFDGQNQYTRRGDFQPDKNGFLVNGAGYYLMGIKIDPTTGNLVGSVPQVLQFQNDFLPAQATTQIDYRANLASYPLTPGHDTSVPGSELLNPANFIANPIAGAPGPARIIGTGATLLPDAVATMTGTTVLPASLVNSGTITINGTNVNLTAGMTPAQVVNAINTAAPPGVTASLSTTPANHLVLTSANADTAVTIAGSATALFTELGVSAGTTNPTNLLTQSAVAAGQTLVVKIGANTTTITFGSGAGQVSTLAKLNGANGLGQLVTGGFASAASANPTNGNVSITAANGTDSIIIDPSTTITPLTFGMHTTKAYPANQTVIGDDVTAFLNASIGGGAVTCYDVSGSPANIQLRWAKVASAAGGGTDTWNLFYQVDSKATGQQVAWKNAGVNYTFGANGQMNPAVPTVTLTNVVVDGVSLGSIQLNHGVGGVTQFADPNGTAQVNLLQQNGFPAGELQQVAVSDKGRIVGSYSNGRTLDLADITLASFNGADYLKRVDGGAFEVTDGSGPAILGAPGKIVGSSLEGSNTDIADEFTKLIVTQQAYSANTRIVSTADQMMQEVMSMKR